MAPGAGTQSHARGRDVLAHLADEMVRAQKQFFGRGPEQARAYFLDDLLLIVMRGGLTRAEETMLEFGHHDQVRAFRQLFENAMTERLTTMVEEATGRKVATYQSQVLFNPTVIIEIFVFDRPADDEVIAATAHGQLAHDDTGAAGDDAPLEGPAGSGQ